MSATTVSPYNEPNEETQRQVYMHFATQACRILKERGSLEPQVFALHVNDGEAPDRAIMLDPQFMSVAMSGGATKDVLGYLIRAMVAPGHPGGAAIVKSFGWQPNLVVQISEAWAIELSAADKEQAAKARELRAGGTSLKDVDGRREVIMLALHTATSMNTGTCPITRDADGKPTATLGPIVFNMQANSRFAPDLAHPGLEDRLDEAAAQPARKSPRPK